MLDTPLLHRDRYIQRGGGGYVGDYYLYEEKLNKNI